VAREEKKQKILALIRTYKSRLDREIWLDFLQPMNPSAIILEERLPIPGLTKNSITQNF